jgi:hypothetical protein
MNSRTYCGRGIAPGDRSNNLRCRDQYAQKGELREQNAASASPVATRSSNRLSTLPEGASARCDQVSNRRKRCSRAPRPKWPLPAPTLRPSQQPAPGPPPRRGDQGNGKSTAGAIEKEALFTTDTIKFLTSTRLHQILVTDRRPVTRPSWQALQREPLAILRRAWPVLVDVHAEPGRSVPARRTSDRSVDM